MARWTRSCVVLWVVACSSRASHDVLDSGASGDGGAAGGKGSDRGGEAGTAGSGAGTGGTGTGGTPADGGGGQSSSGSDSAPDAGGGDAGSERGGSSGSDGGEGSGGVSTGGQAGAGPSGGEGGEGNSREWESLSMNFEHACGIARGALYCWGGNVAGELGVGSHDELPHPVPERVGSKADWTQVSTGVRFTCGIRSGELYCWGENFLGQLGLERIASCPSAPCPVDSSPLRVGGEADWSSVSLGAIHACGIRAGALYCWGANRDGGLGLPMSETQVETTSGPVESKPTRVGEDDDWMGVFVGRFHSCGIRSPGALYCWGLNNRGQIGDGTGGEGADDTVPFPTRIGEWDDWELVDAGDEHTCGIRGGAQYCWGANDVGQLGHEPDVDGCACRQSPVGVGESSTWTNVAAGYHHTCGIDAGLLFCWGLNDVGQLGDSTTTPRSAPTRIGTATAWTLVEASGALLIGSSSAGILQGALFGWGENNHGKLGPGGTILYDPTPVEPDP